MRGEAMYRETEILKQPGTGTPDVFGDMIINVGPQHPATHGVLHLVITLNGETIKKVDIHLVYMHRSIEKMCESLSFILFILFTIKMYYLYSHFHILDLYLF